MTTNEMNVFAEHALPILVLGAEAKDNLFCVPEQTCYNYQASKCATDLFTFGYHCARQILEDNAPDGFHKLIAEPALDKSSPYAVQRFYIEEQVKQIFSTKAAHYRHASLTPDKDNRFIAFDIAAEIFDIDSCVALGHMVEKHVAQVYRACTEEPKLNAWESAVDIMVYAILLFAMEVVG